MNTLYLIDLENVQSAGLEGVELLSEDDYVLVFYSNKADNLKIDLVKKIKDSPAEVDYIKADNGTPNALDFQLITYLFCHLNAADQFWIVSKDTGYDASIKMCRRLDVKNVRRAPAIKNALHFGIRAERSAALKAAKAEAKTAQAEEKPPVLTGNEDAENASVEDTVSFNESGIYITPPEDILTAQAEASTAGISAEEAGAYEDRGDISYALPFAAETSDAPAGDTKTPYAASHIEAAAPEDACIISSDVPADAVKDEPAASHDTAADDSYAAPSVSAGTAKDASAASHDHGDQGIAKDASAADHGAEERTVENPSALFQEEEENIAKGAVSPSTKTSSLTEDMPFGAVSAEAAPAANDRLSSEENATASPDQTPEEVIRIPDSGSKPSDIQTEAPDEKDTGSTDEKDLPFGKDTSENHAAEKFSRPDSAAGKFPKPDSTADGSPTKPASKEPNPARIEKLRAFLSSECEVNADDHELSLLSEGLDRCENKNQFYHFFRRRMGAAHGSAFYKSIRSQLIALKKLAEEQ